MSTEQGTLSAKPYHHGLLKEGCIREGIELLKESGLEKFSLRAVARRLGVSATAIYHHFPAKEDLLQAIAHVGLLEFSDNFKASYQAAASTSEALVAIGHAYVHFFLAHPHYLDLLFSPNSGSDSEMDTAWTETFKLLEGLLIELGLAEKEAELFGIWLWSGVHGLSTMFRDNILGKCDDCSPDKPEVFRMSVDQLLAGVLQTVARTITDAIGKTR